MLYYRAGQSGHSRPATKAEVQTDNTVVDSFGNSNISQEQEKDNKNQIKNSEQKKEGKTNLLDNPEVQEKLNQPVKVDKSAVSIENDGNKFIVE